MSQIEKNLDVVISHFEEKLKGDKKNIGREIILDYLIFIRDSKIPKEISDKFDKKVGN